MNENMISAGIDIGTSTTQLIFSRLTVENTGGFGEVPRIEIVKKEIIYRSSIYFTPLLSENEIDAVAVKSILEKEYTKAGMKPQDVTTGAVIITGETSRKRNAEEVLHALSGIAGDFVAAVAGPDLEGVLAGKGSGAAALSKATGKLVANLDIGGGTTNICYFKDGNVVDTACLDIGGRLIKISEGKITYISSKMKQLLHNRNLSLQVGEAIESEEGLDKLYAIAQQMVRLLEQAINLSPATELLDLMKTNRLITCGVSPELITFSGGVADCMNKSFHNKLHYGDIGVLLGEAIQSSDLLLQRLSKKVKETVNATVIGAGNYSMEVSGSTIEYQNCTFPMKNIPVIEFVIDEQNLNSLSYEMIRSIERYRDEDNTVFAALASRGIECPSFEQLEKLAGEIAKAAMDRLKEDKPVILVLQADIGKALGQALKRILPRNRSILCIDHITCHTGDYIDIGAPIASGKAVPVVVKTLVFNHE